MRCRARQGVGRWVVVEPSRQRATVGRQRIGKLGIGVVNIIEIGIEIHAEERCPIIHIALVAAAADRGCVVDGLGVEGDPTPDATAFIVLNGITESSAVTILIL